MANEVFGGFTALPGGMNSAIDSALLKPTEFARGVNVSVRGGYAETRGGFTNLGALDGTGTFRGAFVWRLNEGDFLVVARGTGVVFRSFDTGAQWTYFGMFADGTSWCHFTQPDRWIMVQDGVGRPAVFQMVNGVPQLYGQNPPLVCIVPGTVGLYLHRRIHYVPLLVPALTPDPATADVLPDSTAESGKMSFVSSDVRDNINPEYVFRMSEHRVVAEGGAYTLPAEFGLIEGMGQLRGAASGTGVGPLIVFGREGVSAFDVSKARASWITSGIGEVLFSGAGTRSSRAIVSVNDDLVYMDTQGDLRFLRYDKTALAGSGGVLYNVPKSNEMRYFIRNQNPDYLPNASATFTDNRFWWTLHGKSDGTYEAMGVLDTIPSYTMSAADPAAYYGVWTGFGFLQAVTARVSQVAGMFAVVKTAAGYSVLQYDDDIVTDPGSTPIRSTVITPAMDLATEGVAVSTQPKQLRYFELQLGNIKRDTTAQVYYRPRGQSEWQLAGSASVAVPGGPAQRRRVKIPVVRDDDLGADPVTKQRFDVSDSFEFMVRWVGFCRVEMFRVVGTALPQPDLPVCDVDNPDSVAYTTDVLDPDFDYEVTL